MKNRSASYDSLSTVSLNNTTRSAYLLEGIEEDFEKFKLDATVHNLLYKPNNL
jgi:hypothetical protein